MVTITYKVNDEEVGTVRWMRDVQNMTWLNKPDNVEVLVSSNLTPTEKAYLNDVLSWVYEDGTGTAVVNGKTIEVSDYLKCSPSDDMIDSLHYVMMESNDNVSKVAAAELLLMYIYTPNGAECVG